MKNFGEVKEKIESEHSGDLDQLDAIFTSDRRLLIEAPAGYGKTKTVVSRIAYDFAARRIPVPKKILGLTFSVNAAFKLRRDISERLPSFFPNSASQYDRLKSQLLVGNYHALSRSILEKYGELLSVNLKQISAMSTVDDSNPEYLTKELNLSRADAVALSAFHSYVKECKSTDVLSTVEDYNERIIKSLIPRGIITYNSILALTRRLLTVNPTLKSFYQKLFAQIIVDEYQDTNSLGLELIRQLIGDTTKVILLGDPLQRIYGFIGAVPDLLSRSAQEFSLRKIELKQNYRFKNNLQMLLLDKNIRENARNPRSPTITQAANVPFHYFENQSEECDWLIQHLKDNLETDKQATFAIIAQSRSPNNTAICEALEANGLEFFFGLFSEDSPDFINFHINALRIFNETVTGLQILNKRALDSIVQSVESGYSDQLTSQTRSLIELLKIFLARVHNDYSFLTDAEQIALVRETLVNRTLKQSMEFLRSRITITTVHGAKGLEWDHVILPDMEQQSFPNWPAMCGKCRFQLRCKLEINNSNESDYLNELSIFYVAVTRARKSITMSASKMALSKNGPQLRNTSCLLRIPGITCINGQKE